MAWNLSYRLFGPTTVHLKHETYLLISLALLEYASVRDVRFTALVTAWLSRNLILRWLLTAHDTKTSSSEKSLAFLGVEKYHRFQLNPLENAIDFVATTVLAGQTFDRPSPHVVAKFVGTNHSAADMMVENDLMGGGGIRNAHRRGNTHHHHGGHYHGERSYSEAFSEWCEATFYKLRDLVPSSFAVASSEAYWMNLARSFGPSPQLLLQATTLSVFYFCWIYPLSEEGGGFVQYFTTIYQDVLQVIRDVHNIAVNRNVIYYHYARHDTTPGPLVSNHALIMETMENAGPAMTYSGEITIDNTRAFGMYQHTFQRTWIDLAFYVVLLGTTLGLAFYGRVLLPIPDLVAGSNEEGNAAIPGGNKGKGGTHHHPRGDLSGGSGSGDSNFERPWLEQYCSIVSEPRLKLVGKVALVKVVENLFLISLLPRTDVVCKTTGQCPNKSGWRELAKVMFHAGITEPLRSDAESYQFEDGRPPFAVGAHQDTPDTLSAIMIGLSVLVVTLSLLLAQAATLNRSHLGLSGYLAGGWAAIKDGRETNAKAGAQQQSLQQQQEQPLHQQPQQTPSSPHKGRSHRSHNQHSGGNHRKSSPESSHKSPNEWVPRKRYKKGGIVCFEGTLYRATINNPEAKPYDFYLWMTHKLFRNELGHPATSRVIAFVSYVQFGLVSVLILQILCLQLLWRGDDHYWTCITCLLWTLAANLVAVYGTVSVAVPNYSELGVLAKEITG